MLSSYDYTGTKQVLSFNNPSVVNDVGDLSELALNLDAQLINNFALSGNRVHVIAAGQFVYDFVNVLPGTEDFINVAVLQTNQGSFKKLANIGTFGLKQYEMVFELALSGDKLIAVGDFDLVNTCLTGWSATSDIDYSAIEWLSSYGPPFDTSITQGTLITHDDWLKIYQNTATWPVTAAFNPTFSGDYVKNIAYYSNNDKKWHSLGLETFIQQKTSVIGDGTYKFNYFTNETCGPFTLFTVATVGTDLYTAGNFFSGGLAKRTTDGHWSIVKNASGGYLGWPDPNGFFLGQAFLFKVNKILYDNIDTLYIGGRFNDYTRTIDPLNRRQLCMTSYNVKTDTFYPLGSSAGLAPSYYDANPNEFELPQVFDIALSGDLVCFGGNFTPGIRAYDRNLGEMVELPALTAILPLTAAGFESSPDLLFFPATAFVTSINISPTLELVVGGTFYDSTSSGFCSIAVYSTTDQAYNTVIFNAPLMPAGIYSLLDPKAQISTMYNHYDILYTHNDTIVMANTILYDNEFFTPASGVNVYGNSPYLGVSGIYVAGVN